MSIRGRALRVAAGSLGLAAGATASAVAYQRVQASLREGEMPAAENVPQPGVDNPDLLFGGNHDAEDGLTFGSLRGQVLNVVTEDGIDLHVEVDEVDPALAGESGWPEDVTVVFAHGFTLNQDAWHFQRRHLRGRVRTVFYDQRSHGRSARSAPEHCTIEQLGRDLERVIATTCPGRAVVVGHSMGGMTVVSLAAQFPDLFGEKVVGAALVATTAGGMDPGRILFPLAPVGALTSGAVNRAVKVLDRGHGFVDRLRSSGIPLARRITDRYSFGDEVPRSWAEFVFDMIDATPFEVVAAFYPTFVSLNLFENLDGFTKVPVTIVGGTADRLTSIGHQRKLHARIPGSELYEAHGAGHMVLMERHSDVDRELDHLITRAAPPARENGRSRRPGRAG
ncbi:alpha/beta fold hydrolase [Nocardioides yefusunii]|uniref:Alpha/beta fold hydrolase n=1 Tax=Nocardioides yefusunii TaxID=2500546 RepID=A0ABW1R2L9_9ACTN|nr:alpha/beta hydrolase [Nocardioides yefusunii]